MSRLDTALKNDLQLLKLLRDELRLQAHVDRAEVTATDARHEVDSARAQLVDTLKKGYAQVKQALKS